MSAEPAQLRRGRLRRTRERRAQAIARVEAYQAWLKDGCDLRKIPPVPKDSEFRLARREAAGMIRAP